jgi:hypothetical protein
MYERVNFERNIKFMSKKEDEDVANRQRESQYDALSDFIIRESISAQAQSIHNNSIHLSPSRSPRSVARSVSRDWQMLSKVAGWAG